MNRTTVTASLLLLICVMSWGSIFPLGKEILAVMSGLALSVWRFVFAIAALAIYLLIRRSAWPVLSPRRYLILMLIGVVGIAGFNISLFTGLKYTAAINGSLIMALSPLVNSLLDALIKRTRLSRVQLFSLLTGFAGVLLVISAGDPQRLLQLDVNRGDLYILGGMLCWSFYTLAAKATIHWLPPLYFTLLTMLGGSAALILLSSLIAGEAPLTQLLQLPGAELAGVLYIGLFATVFAYLFWNQGVATLGVPSASLFFNLVPVFAALTGLLFGQSLTAVQLSGMLLVCGGLAAPTLLQIIKQRRARPLLSAE